MTSLFEAPPVFDLPLSKGGDLQVSLVYTPMVVDGSGDPVLDTNGKKQFEEAPWPSGSSVKLVIDTTTPIVADAVVSGSLASISLDYLVADTVKAKLLWRAVLTHDSGLDEVLANGQTVRADGR